MHLEDTFDDLVRATYHSFFPQHHPLPLGATGLEATGMFSVSITFGFQKQMRDTVKKAAYGDCDSSLGDSLGIDSVACIEHWCFLLPGGSL